MSFWSDILDPASIPQKVAHEVLAKIANKRAKEDESIKVLHNVVKTSNEKTKVIKTSIPTTPDIKQYGSGGSLAYDSSAYDTGSYTSD